MVELGNNQQQNNIYSVHHDYTNGLKIEIPITSSEDVKRYKSALLNILAHIIIDNANESMQDDLKTIYALLLHFELNKQRQWSAYFQDFLVRHEEDYFL